MESLRYRDYKLTVYDSSRAAGKASFPYRVRVMRVQVVASIQLASAQCRAHHWIVAKEPRIADHKRIRSPNGINDLAPLNPWSGMVLGLQHDLTGPIKRNVRRRCPHFISLGNRAHFSQKLENWNAVSVASVLGCFSSPASMPSLHRS